MAGWDRRALRRAKILSLPGVTPLPETPGAANMPSGSESSSDDSDDAAPRPKRPRRSDGADDDVLLPLNDPSYDEGCTRWREYEAVGGKFEAPRSPRCCKKASDDKCACGAVICRRCDESQAATGDVWRSCDVCEDVYACSRCLDQDWHNCSACGTRMCEACSSSCEDCDKHLCPSCSTDVFGDAYCEDCYPKLVARNQDYADEQRALWSEVHGEDYEPSDDEREADRDAIRNELSRYYFY